MLSRKEFFKDLLIRGVRAAREIAAVGEHPHPSDSSSEPGFDAAETELSPALLAIEAERRGLPAGKTDPGELRRAIYRELSRTHAPLAGEACGTAQRSGRGADPVD